MGFFSNLKNAVTGGAVAVTVQCPAAARGQSVAVRIQATARSTANVNNVYLLVRATEAAQVRDNDFVNGRNQTETVHGSRISYQTKITVAGQQQLQEGQSYEWVCELPIPGNANPSFEGEMIRHTWELQAGLDMTGNDPDSGWTKIHVG